MVKLLLSIIFNAFILFAISYFLSANESQNLASGIFVEGGINTYLVGGVILGVINLFIRPVLKLLSLPLFFVFYGLVSVFINGIVLFMLDYILNSLLQIPGVSYKVLGEQFSLDWWVNFVIAVAIFSILNMIYSLIFKK